MGCDVVESGPGMSGQNRTSRRGPFEEFKKSELMFATGLITEMAFTP